MSTDETPTIVKLGTETENSASTFEELVQSDAPRLQRANVPRLSYLEVYTLIRQIPVSEERAFLALVYATMGRVGEITFGENEIGAKDESNPPLSARDIDAIEKTDGSRYLIFKVTREKQRFSSWTTENYVSNTREGIGAGLVGLQRAWLYNAIWPVVAHTKLRRNDPWQYIFPYSTKWGRKVFSKYFGKTVRRATPLGTKFEYNIHLLRAWRAQHFRNGSVTGEKLGIDTIAVLGGWKDTGVLASNYLRGVGSDFKNDLV